ncbi:NAD(P)H-binding protein [Kitasatospora sp. Root107]|uniref:NAD(P)H-binding protein n=1 Tax=Kitasatospora sp. Root107 TaxID=1736424 RepID=UPI001910BADF|nr:NAD(P)H-binding protein [Kitasatospora sp. Root107]
MTGGTGFVGAHSVAAVLRAGCRVRLLVRDPAAVGRSLVPLGVDPGRLELVVGDVTDEGAVAKAVNGAEVVLHAASVYSFDSRRRSEMRRTNVRGTELRASGRCSRPTGRRCGPGRRWAGPGRRTWRPRRPPKRWPADTSSRVPRW